MQLILAMLEMKEFSLGVRQPPNNQYLETSGAIFYESVLEIKDDTLNLKLHFLIMTLTRYSIYPSTPSCNLDKRNNLIS